MAGGGPRDLHLPVKLTPEMTTSMDKDGHNGAGAVNKTVDELSSVHLPMEHLGLQDVNELDNKIQPEDSISQRGSSSTTSTSRSIRSDRATRAMAVEIELEKKVAYLKNHQAIGKNKQKLDEMMEEEEFSRRQRRQELLNMKAELDYKQETLHVQSQLDAARAITKMYDEISCTSKAAPPSKTEQQFTPVLCVLKICI